MAKKTGTIADKLDVGTFDAPRDASEDVRHAVDAYKKIRAGSLRGAATTKKMVEIAKERLDEWKHTK